MPPLEKKFAAKTHEELSLVLIFQWYYTEQEAVTPVRLVEHIILMEEYIGCLLHKGVF